MSQREAILSKIKTIPAIPTASVELIGMLQNPDATIYGLSKCIEQDLGLTTNIMRMANSAYFGSQKSVTTIRDAVLHLGSKNILGIIVGASAKPIVDSSIKGYDLEAGDLWKRSLSVAVCTELLSKEMELKIPNYTFTAALLHDIGKVVLGHFIEVEAQPILSRAFEGNIPFDQAEREILGIDHAEVGAELLNEWQLPDPIVEACRWHHQPDKIEGDTLVVDIIHLADIACSMAGISDGCDGLNYTVSDKTVERMNINNKMLEKVLCKMLDQAKVACSAYEN